MPSKYDELLEYLAANATPLGRSDTHRVRNWGLQTVMESADWTHAKGLTWESYNIKEDAIWICGRYRSAPVSEIAESLRRAAIDSKRDWDWNHLISVARARARELVKERERAESARRAEEVRAEAARRAEEVRAEAARRAEEERVAAVYAAAVELRLGPRLAELEAGIAARIGERLEAKLDAVLAALTPRTARETTLSTLSAQPTREADAPAAEGEVSSQTFLIPYEDSGDAS